MKKFVPIIALIAIVCGSVLSPLSQAIAQTTTNLIQNPSVESVNSANSNLPQGWLQGGWGTNTRSLTYPAVGHTGSKSIKVQISSYTNGDAKWYFSPVNIVPNTQYSFSDYYESNIPSSLVAQFDDGTGKYTYINLGTAPASNTSWVPSTVNFTSPATAKYVTIFHLISKVGWLQTDDFNLTSSVSQPPTAPSVNITSPSNSATVSGTQGITASATDAQGINSVQFKLDGINIGPGISNAPYIYNWDTTTSLNGSHTLTAVATNTSGLSTTSSPVNINVQNQISTPPNEGTNLISNSSVETANSSNSNLPQGWLQGGWGTNTRTLSYSTTGHTGSRSVKVQISSYTNGDAKWYFSPVAVTAGHQYAFTDYYQSNISSELVAQYTTASGYSYVGLGALPASSAWSQSNITFTVPSNVTNVTIFHLVQSVGWLQTDDFSLQDNSSSGSIPTPPTVSINSPTNGSTVSGTQTVSVSATDSDAIAGVQLKIDGVNYGASNTLSPYTFSWDTTGVSNGTHTVSATATDANGATATSSISVTVQNQTTPPPAINNLIPNPSFESSADGTSPDGWLKSSWGSNSPTFTYLGTGHTGNHSVEVQISQYSNGAANWYYNDLPVTAGQSYQYSNWYESNVDTEVDAKVTMSNGSVQWYFVGAAPASTNWNKFTSVFQVPTGASSVAIYQILAKNGYLISDDYSLNVYQPGQFNRALVTITFDDGWTNQYTNALPLLQKYGFRATFYIISGEINDQPNYMSSSQIINLQSAGDEIGSHTVTHPDLTTLTQSQIDYQMSQSQATLEGLLGVPVIDFAYPYGSYNSTTQLIGKKYYQSQRTVDRGYNTYDNLDLTSLKIQEVDSNITAAQVQAWVDQAISQKAWLILVYHQITPDAGSSTVGIYSAAPASFDTELNYINSTGVTVETMHQAINEVLPQTNN